MDGRFGVFGLMDIACYRINIKLILVSVGLFFGHIDRPPDPVLEAEINKRIVSRANKRDGTDK